MIKHIVLLKFSPELSQSSIDQVFVWLDQLRADIPEIRSFHYGKYDSQENRNQGFQYLFEMTFNTPQDRDKYLDHPAHVLVGKKIIALLPEGFNSLIAFDYVFD